MNNKHRKTLAAINVLPINGNIEWRKIESLLLALGVEVVEGDGSLVSFFKGEARLDIHRPHPNKEALRYRIKLVKEFLVLMEQNYDDI